MDQLAYTNEELCLLWKLNEYYDQNPETWHNSEEILKDEKYEFIASDLRFWISHLEDNKLIEISKVRDLFVRIIYEGQLFIKQNPTKFQEFIVQDIASDLNSDSLKEFSKEARKMGQEAVVDAKVQAKFLDLLKHALSTEKEDDQLQREGYVNQGLVGYLNKFEFQDSMPLHQILIEKEGDYFSYIDVDSEELSQQQLSIEETLGFINNGGKGTKRLFRFFNNKSFDHLYCVNPNRSLLDDYGYVQENKNGFGASYLYEDYNELLLPLYVYSTSPNILLFTPLQDVTSDEPKEDKVELETDADILPDTIAKKDSLGRKNLMEIVYNKVDKLWGELQSDQSFTILLNGEWGSGKSSMLYYFEEFLKENKWSVVQYNAWENQRFDEPWWILVNKVSKDASNSCKRFSSISHWFWKNQLEYSLTYIGAFIISIFLIIGLAKDLFGDVKNIGFIGSVLALIGSLWVIVQGTLQNVFKKKTFSALQAKNANDPLEPYKTRFKDVVKNKQVAIFIDDLDRCEVDATVKLLEGIQTLFKNSKVLYVIAADGHWVSNCFDKKYNQFDNLASPGQTIGNQFLQKTFQLIVDVPKLSKPQQQSLLNKYLKREEEKQIDPSAEEDAIEEIEQAETLEQLGEISEGSGGAATKRAAQKAEQIIEQQKEHYMQKLLADDLMPSNPRQMIRLINLFTLKIQELLISEVLSEVGEENVLRYILFATEYPEYNYAIHHLNEDKIKEKFPDLESKLGSLEIQMIRNYL